MSRNLVLCCDGTNNQFGRENTNVVRLVQVLERDPSRQLVYYDPGVGTLPEPSVWSAVGKRISGWIALAFATDLERKVAAAYEYLMTHWEPGDWVFVFGFSRGAYTARVLAAMLHATGLLARGNQNLLPYLQRLFRSLPPRDKATEEDQESYWKLIDEFRGTFAREAPNDPSKRRHFPIHFLGLWDTVSSVGWVWDPRSYPFTAQNPSVQVIRHAVALDERRAFFRQNLFRPMVGQDCKEYWFPGVHADVGGGYRPEDGGLWRLPFDWMITEARGAGMRVDQTRLDQVMAPAAKTARSWADEPHKSLTPAWRIAEIFPKLHWQQDRGYRLHVNLGHHRRVHPGALIHRGALMRIRELGYCPPNLSPAFIEAVKGLSVVPEVMPYLKDGAAANGNTNVGGGAS